MTLTRRQSSAFQRSRFSGVAVPEAPDLSRFPLFANASPVVVDVRAGETLYLPALWHHQVSHPVGGVTIAVNTWRDMDFMSGTYASYSLLRAAAILTTREE